MENEKQREKKHKPLLLYIALVLSLQEMMPCLVARNRTQSANNESDLENFIKKFWLIRKNTWVMFQNKRWKNNIDRYLRHILGIEEGKCWCVLEKFRSMMQAATHASRSRKAILAKRKRTNIIFWERSMWCGTLSEGIMVNIVATCLPVGKGWHTHPLCWDRGFDYGLISKRLQNFVCEGWN